MIIAPLQVARKGLLCHFESQKVSHAQVGLNAANFGNQQPSAWAQVCNPAWPNGFRAWHMAPADFLCIGEDVGLDGFMLRGMIHCPILLV